jgi:hypothetical protein
LEVWSGTEAYNWLIRHSLQYPLDAPHRIESAKNLPHPLTRVVILTLNAVKWKDPDELRITQTVETF